MTDILLRFGPTLCLLAVAAYFDLRWGIIPNRLVLIGLGVLLPLKFVTFAYLTPHEVGFPLGLLGTSAAGLIVCSIAPLALFYASGMGGGDVKLLSLQGALLGPSVGLEVELYAFFLIALYAMIKLAYHGRLLAMLSSTVGLTRNAFVTKERRQPVPSELLTSLRFAPAVLAAMLLITSMETFTR